MIGTLLQLAVIAATLPRPRECPNGLCAIVEPDWVQVLDLWRPFIDNIGAGASGDGQERNCPGPRPAGSTFSLDHSPLPAEFRPDGRESAVLACVRVGPDESIGSVRLIAGTGQAGLDRQLTETIRRQWRFEPIGPRPSPGWQRVRLSR